VRLAIWKELYQLYSVAMMQMLSDGHSVSPSTPPWPHLAHGTTGFFCMQLILLGSQMKVLIALIVGAFLLRIARGSFLRC